MKVTLRPYQTKAVDEIRAALASGAQAPVLVMPTGSGKSLCFVYIAFHAAQKGKSICIIVHRDELVWQTSAELDRWGVPHGLVVAGQPILPRKVLVASVWTLARRLDKVPQFDLGIVDECFPAGTPVDGRPIETIRPGDLVRSVNHASGRVEMRPVVRVFRRAAGAMVTVHLSDGRAIACTAGHPFFCDGEYVPAILLPEGGQLVESRDGVLFRVLGSGEVRWQNDARTGAPRPRLLLCGLPRPLCFADEQRAHGRDQQAACVGSNDRSQSYAQRSLGRKNAPEADRPSVSNAAWRERPSDGAAEDARRTAGFADGSRNPNQAGLGAIRQSSELLQGRSGGPIGAPSHRSGWLLPQYQGYQAERPTEDGRSAGPRVVRVEVHQPTGDGRYRDLCPDGAVYNIEVEGNHNYFASDVLVHNCHHAAAGSWAKVMAHFKFARWLGVTATPMRLDGKGLDDKFDAMILGPSMRELIDMRFLAMPQLFAPPVMPDLKGLRKRGGDISAGEAAARMDKAGITGNAVVHYMQHLQGRPAIAFCATLEHANHVAEDFRKAGLLAATIEGAQDRPTRKKMIADLAGGALNVLCSCEVISEGVDVPVCQGAILLRPTASLTLYLQQVGRALRPKQDGSKAIILDHAANSHTHGHPAMDRAWTLAGGYVEEKKKTLIRTCQACLAIFEIWKKVCPNCGHEQETQGRQIEHRDGELIELAGEQLVIPLNRVEKVRKELAYLRTVERRNHYKTGWAEHVVKARVKKDEARAARADGLLL